MHTVVGIDLGTQSLKVVFYDFTDREIVASERSPLDLHRRDDGSAEQQAHWWLDALYGALNRIDRDIRASAVAVGVSGQQHGLVPLGPDGEVLAPVKLWCDTSTIAECDEITQAFGGRERCIEAVGNPILPGYTASKLRWFAKAQPGRYQRMQTILLPHDYLNFHLTGERVMEAGDASGTGFLDIRRRRWSGEMLRAVDPDRDLLDCLPPVEARFGFIGQVRPEVSERSGLPAGIPVSAGGGDNMMGAIGTGNVSSGKVTMSLGTSGTVYAYSDSAVIDPAGEIAAFCSSTGGWMPLMCTMNCTVATESMRTLLGADRAGFEAQVSSTPRGAGGLITVPFFNGERTPDLPRAKACLVGLDGRNAQAGNLLRSAMEGATFALRHGLERLRDLGIEATEIALTGGGAKSASWRQAVADICKLPLTVLAQDEGASFGAALQALAALEGAKRADLQPLTDRHLRRDESRCCEPDAVAVDFYEDAYSAYRDAVRAISPLYRE